jgi:peptidoglycan/xylan/chitin deacetylase (PgdA/CDA1 family)
MNMQKVICRSDDFDFRLNVDQYAKVHQKFIDANLTETAVIQFTNDNRVNFNKQVIFDYLKTSPNYDIQLHGWSHAHYSEMEFDEMVRDIAASMAVSKRFLGVYPTVWYPPRNCYSPTMQRVADIFGLKMDTEAVGIKEFVEKNRKEKFEPHAVYFHAWNHAEMEYLDEMITILKELCK